MSVPAAASPGVDPIAVLRSRSYITALVLAAVLGVPISVLAYGFLALVAAVQQFVFVGLPSGLLGGTAPAWWPVPWLVLCGLLTAATIRYLPGTGGHSPSAGFATGGAPPSGRELVGIVLAALTTLSLGAVLGPEGPLIAIGGGLGALAIHLVKKDAPPMALTIMASAGSFAAISTLLGSPVLGAFLIMEAAGISGMTLSLVALPGLLAAGVGALVFVGLDGWTGLGSFSLALPAVPPAVPPTVATLGWAVLMGVVGALSGWAIRWAALSLRPIVHWNRVLVTTALGALIGVTAMAYQLISGLSFTQVLFSGQDALPELVGNAADYSLPVLVLLIVCKTLVYAFSLSAFRGGPVFPSMFIGAALGLAASGLPGMDPAAGIGMGMGAMCTAMLRLPLTSTLLATLLLGVDGVAVTPQVVVAVVVAFVVINVLPAPGPQERGSKEPGPPGDIAAGHHRAPMNTGATAAVAAPARPARRERQIAWLFIIGSGLFALGAVPPYADAVGAHLCGLTFFTGSLFFTAAAYLQYREAVDALPLPDTRRHSFWAWAPGNAVWFAGAVQLAGTLWFNWSTANALLTNLSAAVAEQRVWRPDALGSVAFLVASGQALRYARSSAVAGGPTPRSWTISVINMAGSVAFGISAAASFVLPSSGDVLNAGLAGFGTFVGALCFLTGAILMLSPEPAGAPVPADRGTRP
ncbi:chloride channel protein [Arthrobacter sp. Ld5]|uniref:chloride channel protein n=1 Tax=Arthrobacter sp. Ld5 TaxID=649152 RepID=UPI003EB85E31